ncbi:hypothetical protein CHT99_16730 [Sphingobacterium cellulitidis]|nr:hypothetical protein CHT99_16730 [Sphingobacterium cellulitidis]
MERGPMTSEVHHLFGPITSENQTEFWLSGQRNQWPCLAEISGPLASVLYIHIKVFILLIYL